MPSLRAILGCLLLLPSAAAAWPISRMGDGPTFLRDVGTDCDDLSSEPITYGLVYDLPGSGVPVSILDVHDIWLAGGCVGCHQLNSAMNGGLLLNDPGFAAPQVLLPSAREPTILRVFNGNPEGSLLYTMLNCTPPPTFPVMPLPMGMGSTRIARSLRAMVYDWIEQGARGVDGDGNPISEVLFRDQLESTRLQRNLVTPTPPSAAIFRSNYP
jgi:hypothetical protein